MVAELRVHLGAWWAQRQVQRATVAVVVATVVGLGACAWRIRADGSTVPVSDLASGHRHLLVPLALVVLVAAGLAGSVASWNGAAGWSAVVAGTGSSTRRGWRLQAVTAGLGAATWATVVAAAITMAAAGAIGAVGGGPAARGIDLADLVVLAGRVGISAGALGLFAGVVGAVLAGRSLPGVAAPLVVLAAEAVALVASEGSVNLLGGASLGVLLVGGDQGRPLGLGPGDSAVVCALVWLVLPAASLLALAGIERTKGLG